MSVKLLTVAFTVTLTHMGFMMTVSETFLSMVCGLRLLLEKAFD